MTAPCKDCPDKGCGARHSTCEKYLQFRKECEKQYEKNSRNVFYQPKYNKEGRI